MTTEEFEEKLNEIQKMKCETKTLELKSAGVDCPKRLYDTLSSFSNQDDGGILIFGVDEAKDYLESGVYDPQDLQKKINAQCLQMEPVVRPLLTVLEKDGKYFVAAEIPGMDLAERPCHYRGQGRLKGSYVRIGDSDEPMTEYEIYSYEAFRRKYQDDIREVPRATLSALNQNELSRYVRMLKEGKPNLANLSDQEIYELMSITRNGAVTLSAVILFSPYPQAYFPQLCITAVSVPGRSVGETGDKGARFLDNERIEGNVLQILEGALQFLKMNMKSLTIIDPQTGHREDRTDYPMLAAREALINALVHRDYRRTTAGMPRQHILIEDRMEIHNPGGIYGRMRADQLGKAQPDTRNPVLATALEVLKVTENRYSGIPTMRYEMKRYGLKEPEFLDERGNFIVRFYKEAAENGQTVPDLDEDMKNLLLFCQTPRTRQEICGFLGLSSATYAVQKYVMPLVKADLIRLSLPEKPGSSRQLFYTNPELKNDTLMNYVQV